MDAAKRLNSIMKAPAMFIGVDGGSPTHGDRRKTERENMMVLWSLVVKSLLEMVMKERNRLLAPDARELRDAFVLLERILRHGLRPAPLVSLRASSPEAQLWALIARLAASSPDLAESTACVAGLPGLDGPATRLRAWLRLALMQKKLGDYLGALVDARELTKAAYEDWAFVRSDAATPFAGSLIGLRVIDCNLYLKEEELAAQPMQIELAHYIKLPTVAAVEADSVSDEEESELKTILDQKNFLEEHNRQLQANVTNLEKRIATLEQIRGFRPQLPVQVDVAGGAPPTAALVPPSKDGDPGVQHESQDTIVKEDVAEVSSEVEGLRQLIAERQDSLVSLRLQMEDVKRINQDLYTKLRVCEEAARDDAADAARWETQLKELETFSNATAAKLKGELSSAQTALATATSRESSLSAQLSSTAAEARSLSASLGTAEGRVRELSSAGAAQAALVAELEAEVAGLRLGEPELARLRLREAELGARVSEYERALVELGVELSGAKLAVVGHKEGLDALAEAAWEKDETVKECKGCTSEFGVARRRHHCRNCGGIFCNACSEQTMPLPAFPKPVRVCDPCYALLLTRFSKPAN